MLTRLLSLSNGSRRTSRSTTFFPENKSSMLLVSPRVTDSTESPRDGEPSCCRRRLTEVSERSDVLELGIQAELDGLPPELVRWDTTTELSLERRSTESVI